MGFRTERQRLEAQKENLRNQMERSESWEEAAAREEPGNLEQWRSEVAGTNPAAEAPPALQPLEERVRDLRAEQQAIDTEISDMETQVPPGASSQSLEADVARAELEVEARQREVQSARTAAERAKAQETEAAENARRAETDRAAKESELEQVKKDEAAAADELNTLERGANPAGEGLAGSGQHLRPPGDGGGESNPALREYQDLLRRSDELSKQYKPDLARGTEQLLKDGLQKVGKTWEQAFDGQSMEDMIKGIEKTKARLATIESELNAKRQEYDSIRGDTGAKLQTLKERLDQCIASHTFWQGPEKSGGS
jgi:DNA repair exonuclease SbcCD ATPase subunit